MAALAVPSRRVTTRRFEIGSNDIELRIANLETSTSPASSMSVIIVLSITWRFKRECSRPLEKSTCTPFHRFPHLRCSPQPLLTLIPPKRYRLTATSSRRATPIPSRTAPRRPRRSGPSTLSQTRAVAAPTCPRPRPIAAPPPTCPPSTTRPSSDTPCSSCSACRTTDTRSCATPRRGRAARHRSWEAGTSTSSTNTRPCARAAGPLQSTLCSSRRRWTPPGGRVVASRATGCGRGRCVARVRGMFRGGSRSRRVKPLRMHRVHPAIVFLVTYPKARCGRKRTRSAAVEAAPSSPGRSPAPVTGRR
ncbi:hypothetical protein VFPBJ_01733 [Purpureocillium lilacinum]|uniref:Uncharacterized protein n=1 Tax=Purpureocillium lilacinum TaxID=33203 RepID=A0A179HDX0_PURLI|nr:hypothetical protein VFPBJ_01733 [Purpureocillium lilacinum]